LQTALEPLAIEIGTEVLAVWRDRAQTGREPIPVGALRNLAAAVDQLLLDSRASQACVGDQQRSGQRGM
jgi:hypothetical protein